MVGERTRVSVGLVKKVWGKRARLWPNEHHNLQDGELRQDEYRPFADIDQYRFEEPRSIDYQVMRCFPLLSSERTGPPRGLERKHHLFSPK